MGLKLAVSGKGGTGKTTITSIIARYLAYKYSDHKVIAIDADPVSNLAAYLGISDKQEITPIAQLSDLIAERTGVKPGTIGGFFSLNPKVDDIPERFSIEKDNVKLLIMGGVQKGGSGCICPESAVLRVLIQHLILFRNEIVIMDMEAGIEHLGRATSSAVDGLLIIVNPGSRSHIAARTIRNLGKDIGIKNFFIIGNRIKDDQDEKLIKESLSDFTILGFIPETKEIAEADRKGLRPFDNINDISNNFKFICDKLMNLNS